MKRFLFINLFMLLAFAWAANAVAQENRIEENIIEAEEAQADPNEEKLDIKGIIFDHLGDGYGWEAPFNHHAKIPLPVIVYASDGWHVFSSAHLTHGEEYTDGNATFVIPKDGEYKGKVVEIVNGEYRRPFDVSITKNVCAILIACLLVGLCCLLLARWHKQKGYKAPRKGLGAFEALLEFIYNGVIKNTLKENTHRFAPYLMTVFLFIFFMNLLGLIVIFPGGANVTGNIAVTLVLAVITFLVTNIFGTKHYWKEIFWPDVPLWLKVPIPIMPVIEIFGIFTKPAALTVRLFANMMGGHMIVIVLTLLIFIFADFGMAVMGGTTVVSVVFSVFMLLIDVLVSFIQAYVFTLLSTLFIALAQEHEHKKDEEKEKATVGAPAITSASVTN